MLLLFALAATMVQEQNANAVLGENADESGTAVAEDDGHAVN